VTYLRDGSCKDHNLVQLADALHELINARPLDHIDIVVLSLDLYRYGEIGLSQNLYRVRCVVERCEAA
jgi:hypothetical protein